MSLTYLIIWIIEYEYTKRRRFCTHKSFWEKRPFLYKKTQDSITFPYAFTLFIILAAPVPFRA